MGSMTRRMMKQARRRLGELTDEVFEALEDLAEFADDAGDDDAVTWCEQALSVLEDTLTPDGLPTSNTEQLLPEIVRGPLALALQPLRPQLSAAAESHAGP